MVCFNDNSYLHWRSSFLLGVFIFQNWRYSYTERSDDNSYLHWRSSFLFLPVPFSSSPAPCMPLLPAVVWPRTSQCRQNSGSTIAAQQTKQSVQQLLHSKQTKQWAELAQIVVGAHGQHLTLYCMFAVPSFFYKITQPQCHASPNRKWADADTWTWQSPHIPMFSFYVAKSVRKSSSGRLNYSQLNLDKCCKQIYWYNKRCEQILRYHGWEKKVLKYLLWWRRKTEHCNHKTFVFF